MVSNVQIWYVDVDVDDGDVDVDVDDGDVDVDNTPL